MVILRGKSSKGGGVRNLSVKVKTSKGRKTSSTRWLQRQLNDPYVAAAKREGYRSRAAYKLLEITEKYSILQPGMQVIDLGAAPGGWSQVAARLVEADRGNGGVVAVDISTMEPIAGVELLCCDFMANETPDIITGLIGGEADAVLSDMASPATGHKSTDHIRIVALCEAALDFTTRILRPDGVFLAKVLQGGTEHELLKAMRKDFKSVRHVKPEASRADSAESYVLATGFKGGKQRK
jgi:23S rRNA (uridine2552-2'-O)-methyltransferase